MYILLSLKISETCSGGHYRLHFMNATSLKCKMLQHVNHICDPSAQNPMLRFLHAEFNIPLCRAQSVIQNGGN